MEVEFRNLFSSPQLTCLFSSLLIKSCWDLYHLREGIIEHYYPCTVKTHWEKIHWIHMTGIRLSSIGFLSQIGRREGFQRSGHRGGGGGFWKLRKHQTSFLNCAVVLWNLSESLRIYFEQENEGKITTEKFFHTRNFPTFPCNFRTWMKNFGLLKCEINIFGYDCLLGAKSFLPFEDFSDLCGTIWKVV